MEKNASFSRRDLITLAGASLATAAAFTVSSPIRSPVDSASANPTYSAPFSPAWKQVFFEDFTGSHWWPAFSAYSGQPSSDPRARWDPRMVRLCDGRLILSGAPDPQHPGRWLTGGVSNWRHARIYGRWDLRFRAAPSEVLSYHFLLWPRSESWPPEIDITEGFSRDRQSASAFVHWRDKTGMRRKQEFPASADFTAWHTASVEWTPDAVRLLMDGAPYAEITGAAVPHEPMFLALQTETQLSGSESGPTDYVEVDWVRISAPV